MQASANTTASASSQTKFADHSNMGKTTIHYGCWAMLDQAR
ncbi:MAG: hypothetical protein SFT93_00250 [Rickettsiaceae bacterium]|nr:hypothetical protein [Rickettsiaceae bacterium]